MPLSKEAHGTDASKGQGEAEQGSMRQDGEQGRRSPGDGRNNKHRREGGMRQVSRDELKDILERHRKWAFCEEGGDRADLRNADLRGADLSGADLRGADLRNADLSGADLSGADLSGADLSGADLRGADLRNADLSGAYLRSADLRNADLSGAYLRSADLRSADLNGAYLNGAVGNSRHMKSIFLDTYPITYTAEVLQIGCQRHAIADWWAFSDERIGLMDGARAVAWWAKYKAFIRQAIELSPAEPTGAEGKERESKDAA